MSNPSIDSDELDALGLVAVRQNTLVRLGPSEVSMAVVHAKMTSALNKMADGIFVVDFTQSAESCDFFGGIVVASGPKGSEVPQFTGSVISAIPHEDGTEIKAVSSVSLSESIIPGMVTRGIPPHEAIYVLARSSGIRDENLQITGLAELPLETFEILVPIHGVVVEEKLKFGRIAFLPADDNIYSLAEIDKSNDMRADFNSPTYALALVTATLALEAEAKGLAAIDLTLAWLSTQLHYGLTHLPNGAPLTFNRRESLAQPRRGDVVFVRGLSTLRQWLRRPRSAKQARFIDLTDTTRSIDHDLPTLTLQEEQALRALSRATEEVDPLAQVQSLWEAIEFYVGDASASKLFNKTEVNAILATLPSLPAAQQERVEDVISQLNNAPLSARLVKVLDDEEVPINEGELKLLSRLRKLRNDIVHGRGRELPRAEDVEYGISIVSRMLVYRISAKKRIA